MDSVTVVELELVRAMVSIKWQMVVYFPIITFLLGIIAFDRKRK